MKIGHIADIHWGIGYRGPTSTARFDDICKTMDWVANQMIAERCDIVIVAGDIFRKSDVPLEKSSKEIRACTAWLRKLIAAGIEIFIISGTPSHDPFGAYEILEDYQLPKVTIAKEPIWYDHDGEYGFSIVCVPGMDRSNFVSKEEYRGLPAHVVHQMMTDHITETCQQFLKESNYSPSILVGHFTYDLADTGFEDVLMQQEAILTTEAVAGYDLVTLGHIHRPQQNGNVFYSGSPERLSFNDEKVDAGFWIHDWDGRQFDSRFIDTPARKYYTLNLSEDEIADFVHGNNNFEYASDNLKDAVIRVTFSCSEDLNRQLNRRTLDKALYDLGAYYVDGIKGEVKRSEDRLRDAEITEALGPIDALRKWASKQGIDPVEIDELAGMTAELMEVSTNAL